MQRAELRIESGRFRAAHAAALQAWERHEPALHKMFLNRLEHHKFQ
jgi:hypothetical protein